MGEFTKAAEAATREMRALFPETPLQENQHLSLMYDARIFLKREDLSPVRSYKIRGAFNAMRSAPLPATTRRAWRLPASTSACMA
jgi:threonine dehydratase